MEALPSLLLLDKPKGISSFSVIRELRRRTGLKKFGHAGTLDPLASGLLLIGVGSGTKALTALVGLDKEYVAEILIGEQRTTGDMEGVIISEQSYADDLTTELVTTILQGMVGTLTLPVSAYSAIKKDGVPMYKRARKAEQKGEVVSDLPVRDMEVYTANLTGFALVEVNTAHRLLLTVTWSVSSGTYVRSLAEELGRRLGYPATLYNLRRTRVGEYRIEDARQLADI